jgi:hypothetical protein
VKRKWCKSSLTDRQLIAAAAAAAAAAEIIPTKPDRSPTADPVLHLIQRRICSPSYRFDCIGSFSS